MTLADAVTIVSVRIIVERGRVPTFDALMTEVHKIHADASATEIDAAARPYEVGQPGAYRYEREGGPGHCPCQSDVDNIGSATHLTACPWSDPDYDDEDAGATGGR